IGTCGASKRIGALPAACRRRMRGAAIRSADRGGRQMTSWPVRYLSALCVAFFCGSAGAQEPFKEMNRLLDEAGADRSHFFSVAPTQQSITYPNLRGSGNRPSFEVLDEFLYALNIRKFVYFVDDKTADIAPG